MSVPVDTAPTPNPNSVKLTPSEGVLLRDHPMLAIKAPADAQGHALGEALIGLDGVIDVFMMPAFVTLTKADDASWDGVLDTARSLISEHVEAA